MELREGIKFCPVCGTKIETSMKKTKFCDECGVEIGFEALFCPKCGHKQSYGVESEEPRVKESLSVDNTSIVENPLPNVIDAIDNVIEDSEITTDEDPAIIVISRQEETLDPATVLTDQEPLLEEEPKSPVFAIQCPQCGSTDVDMITDTNGKCRHCGAGVIIDDKPKSIVNNIQVSVQQKKEENAISFYRVKEEKTEKQFLLDVYKTFVEHDKIPIDIFDYTFYPVTKQERRVLAYQGDVHVTYSAMVGVDKRVEYVDTDGKTKEKTVTDWHPTSGTYDENLIVGIPDGDIGSVVDTDKYATYFAHAVSYAKDIEEFNGDGIIITPNSQKAGEYRLKEMAESNCEHSISGDRVKDFHGSSTVTLQCVRGYIIPEYSMLYKKNPNDEKTYIASGYAAGDDFVYGDGPDDSSGINADTAFYNLKTTIPSILLSITAILLAFLVNNETLIWMMGLAAFLFFVISCSLQRSFRKKAIQKRSDVKKKRMADFLKKKKFA